MCVTVIPGFILFNILMIYRDGRPNQFIYTPLLKGETYPVWVVELLTNNSLYIHMLTNKQYRFRSIWVF